MKYWKGNKGTIKENQYGIMDNDGFVPDSTETTKNFYNNYLKSLPVPEPAPESDIEKLVKFAKNRGWIN